MGAILFVVITAIIYIVGDLLLLKCKPLRNAVFSEIDTAKLFRRSGAVGIINILGLLICNIYVSMFTSVQTPVSVFACVLVSIFVYAAFVAVSCIPKNSLTRFLKGCAIICIIPFLLEIFVFNAKSVDQHKIEFTPPIQNYRVWSGDNVYIKNNMVHFESDGSVVVYVNRANLNAAHIEFDGNNKSLFNCELSMRDENFSSTYISVGNKQTSINRGYCDFTFSPYEKLNSIKLNLSEIKGSVNIKSITFLSALPFNFSLLRFLLIFAAGSLIYLIYHFKLYKVIYNRRKKLHRIVIACVLLFCLLSAFMFIFPNQSQIDYQSINPQGCDHYVQMFDSVCKGQANLDLPVDPKLKELSNPYDSSLRSENKVTVEWDRAYYNGQYYSYFGIVPVFVFYFPYYFITGKLPTMNMTSLFFSLLSIIFLFGAVLTAVKKFVKRPNMLLLIFGLITAVFSSGIYYSLDLSNIYFAAVISSMSFLLLCLWMGLAAYNEKSAKKQISFLFISGLSFILCVGCRPTMAINALILAPAFIYLLVNKNYSIKRRLCCAGIFLAPIIVGAACLLWYNYIRFDSFFEFGTAYQLTVNDIHANKISLAYLPSAIIQYFLQPMTFTSTFPHIAMSSVHLANYGHYVYLDNQLALISFPSIVLALAALPLVLKNHRKGIRRKDSNSYVKFFTYIMIVILSVVIIWLDYCMAGTAFRYLIDILPTLSILSILVFLECNTNFATTPSIQHKGTALCCASMVLTSLIVFMQLLTFPLQALFAEFPNILFATQDLFEFWC